MTELAVTVQNRINNATDNGGNVRTNWIRRWHHTIGSGDVSQFRLSYDNWRGEASNNQVVNTGNDHTITQGIIECNGIALPITFSGGSRSVVVVDGVARLMSDYIFPASFGLTSFTRGLTFWTKEAGTMPTATSKMPTGFRQPTDFTGDQIYFYDPALTTISDPDALGIFTLVSGNALYARASGACPIVLGTFVGGDKEVRMMKGDSQSQGTGDGSAFKNGRGWFQRATVDADGVSNPVASINFAVHGSTAALQYQDSRIQSYDVNTNSLTVFEGYNDFGTAGTGQTVAGMSARVQTIKNNYKANVPTAKCAIMQYGPRADSTDVWATEANQTTLTNWDAAGLPNQFVAVMPTLGFDAVFTCESVKGTDRYKFLCNGTARYTAFDNTHWSAFGHQSVANENRAGLSSIAPSFITASSNPRRSIYSAGIGIGL